MAVVVQERDAVHLCHGGNQEIRWSGASAPTLCRQRSLSAQGGQLDTRVDGEVWKPAETSASTR